MNHWIQNSQTPKTPPFGIVSCSKAALKVLHCILAISAIHLWLYIGISSAYHTDYGQNNIIYWFLLSWISGTMPLKPCFCMAVMRWAATVSLMSYTSVDYNQYPLFDLCFFPTPCEKIKVFTNAMTHRNKDYLQRHSEIARLGPWVLASALRYFSKKMSNSVFGTVPVGPNFIYDMHLQKKHWPCSGPISSPVQNMKIKSSDSRMPGWVCFSCFVWYLMVLLG